MWLGVVICSVLWGSAFPVIKLVYAHWAAGGTQHDFALRSFFSGLRFTVAGGALLLLARSPMGELRETGWRWVIAMALTQTVGQYLLFYWGFTDLPHYERGNHFFSYLGERVEPALIMWEVSNLFENIGRGLRHETLGQSNETASHVGKKESQQNAGTTNPLGGRHEITQRYQCGHHGQHEW